MRTLIRTKHHRVFFEKNWRSRPRSYWFNAKYPHDGSRRICISLFTIDLNI